MKVVFLDDNLYAVKRMASYERLRDHEVRIVHEHIPDIPTLAASVRDAEALVLNRERTPVTQALVERLPRLALISQTGTATPHIDLPACTKKGIVVSAGGRAPMATVELTWALILAARRRVALEAARLRTGRWQSELGTTVRGRTLGIFGYGTIGSEVARIAPSFGMHVLVWGRESSLARAKDDGFATVASKSALFERSDVLSVHLKLNDETRGIVSAADLARMKSSSLIVNTSRAGLFALGALVMALRAGRPGYAALDVFDHEPILDPQDPLLRMDNVLGTPHIGHVEQDAYEHFYGIAVDQVLAFAAGAPINVANPDVVNL